MKVFFQGLLFGLILALAVGPVFFKLIQTSIHKGFLFGLFMTIGVSISDIIYAFLAYYGLSQVVNNEQFRFLMGIGGGLILMGFGLVTLFRSVSPPPIENDKSKKNLIAEIFKGFVINALNPFVLLFWIGALSVATVEYKLGDSEIKYFLITALATVLIADMTKSFLANRIRKVITARQLRRLSRIVGLALLLFGLRLIYYAFYL